MHKESKAKQSAVARTLTDRVNNQDLLLSYAREKWKIFIGQLLRIDANDVEPITRKHFRSKSERKVKSVLKRNIVYQTELVDDSKQLKAVKVSLFRSIVKILLDKEAVSNVIATGLCTHFDLHSHDTE